MDFDSVTCERFDRRRIEFLPLSRRENKFRIEEIAFDPEGSVPDAGPAAAAIEKIAERIRSARRRGAPVVLCHGAHAVKNGLGPLFARLVEEGWVTHLATNGAGSIHDWEFAYQGASCEDVRRYVAEGRFGLWEETGRWIGLALLRGALDGLGYGGAVGRLIAEERLEVPAADELEALAARGCGPAESRAAALDFLAVLEEELVLPGKHTVPHRWARYSEQAACWRLGVPFTVHPGIGQDIIYGHPLVKGGAVGRTSLRDFLSYAASIARLEGGVYISSGSSVMSPMVFEKSLAMARNLARREGRDIADFLIAVNDLAEVRWDWSGGEPPPEDPAYYVRYAKSFSRMGGDLLYVGLDNRIFFGNLYRMLRGTGTHSGDSEGGR